MKKISIYDFKTPAGFTAIATYAYLRSKQAQGYPLTDDELDLLKGNVHNSQLSMVMNSNYYYPHTRTENGFMTELNLETYIKISAAKIVSEINEETEFDMDYLLAEMTLKMSVNSVLPQNIPTISTNTEIFPDGTVLVFTKISTNFGAVIKCYKYQTMDFDDLICELPFIGQGIRLVMKTAKTTPDWDSIVHCNGLWDDLMYAYCRKTFGIDFELVYRCNENNLPDILLNRIKADISEMLPILKEKYYDIG